MQLIFINVKQDNMRSKNKLIYLIRQIIGDEEASGFYTKVVNNNELYKVPNYLFKDAPAEYPEVRISPFVEDVEVTHGRRFDCLRNRLIKQRYYKAIFQVDIYATTVQMVNNIYDAIYERIDLFNDYDVIVYGYNRSFRKINENEYYTRIYNTRNFNIFRILINNNIIRRVDNVNKIQNNTYMITEDGLYIQTTLPIHKIRIFHILNGLTFSNGKIAYSENILQLDVQNKKMLSELEKNNVERITFDLSIFYNMHQDRNPGPILEDVDIISD